MDNIEKRINEITKLNEEIMKEEKEENNDKNIKTNINMLDKIQSKEIYIIFPLINSINLLIFSANIFSDDTVRNSIETKRFPYGNIGLKDIKDNAKDLINNFVKKYDKIN